MSNVPLPLCGGYTYCSCAQTVLGDNFPVAIGGEGGRILVENLSLCFNTTNYAKDILVGLT